MKTDYLLPFNCLHINSYSLIDLSAIDANDKTSGNQAFNYIADKAFSKTDASGQLRFDAAMSVLYGSTDKDSDAEFAIQLNGVKTLVSDDFVL